MPMQVATPAETPVNVELMPLNEFDLLGDSVLPSSEVDLVLNDISCQQLNVTNQ